MARAKALEGCFLCEQTPCKCRELARAAKARAKPEPRVKSAPTPRPMPSPPPILEGHEAEDPWPLSPVDPPAPVKMPEPIRSKPIVKPPPRVAQFQEVISEDEREMRRALHVLVDENMLMPDDVVRLQKRLGLPDWKVQAYVWRHSW